MAQAQKQDIEIGITRYEYGESSRKRVGVLQIETSKYYNGGVISDASVCWVGDHSRQQCISLGTGNGDYSKRLKVNQDVKATQRNINTQHTEVFTPEAITQLLEAAKAHYATVVRAGADGFGNTYPTEVA